MDKLIKYQYDLRLQAEKDLLKKGIKPCNPKWKEIKSNIYKKYFDTCKVHNNNVDRFPTVKVLIGQVGNF